MRIKSKGFSGGQADIYCTSWANIHENDQIIDHDSRSAFHYLV